MINRGVRRLKSWMFIYAGLIAAAAFAGDHRSPGFENINQLSPVAAEPVVLEASARTLRITPLVKRTDI